MKTKIQHQSLKRALRSYVLVAVSLFILSGCASSKLFNGKTPAGNFRDFIADSQGKEMHLIKPDDKVNLSIWNHEDLSVGSIYSIYNSNEVYGKWMLVDQQGDVLLPQIGKVHVGGLTVEQATALLTEKYSAKLVDPIINFKVLNREVTVLGEVKSKGTILLEKEKNTLLEVIGKSGGFDYYANTKEIKIIRTEGGVQKQFIVNLSKADEIEQASLYMQSGDIVYVPTRAGKTVDKKAPLMIAFASFITALAVLVSL